MSNSLTPTRSVSQIIPLLRSISRELRERTEAIEALEERLEAFSSTRRIHEADVANIQAELMTQRRELRYAEQELERLGCSLDEKDGKRIVFQGQEGGFSFSWNLDDTQFYRRMPTPSPA